MSVVKFADIVKSVSDVFSDDYKTKNILKIKHVTPNDVTVTSESELDAQFTAIAGNANLKYKHSSGFSLDKLAVKAGKAGKVTFSAETSLVGVAPGLKFTFKGDDANEGKLGAEYTTETMTVTGELDVHRLTALEVSSAFAVNKFVAGAEVSYDGAAKGGFSEGLKTLNVGASYVMGDAFVGVVTQNKFKGAKISAMTRPLPNVTLATEVTAGSSPLSANLGVIYSCHSTTTLRAKASTSKELAASVSYTPVKKTNVVVAASYDMNTHSTKHGVSITLG